MIPHGTSYGYGYHKCRCEECRAYKSACNRSHYIRNPQQYETWRAANKEKNQQSALARYNKQMATDPESVRRDRREYAKTPNGRLIRRVYRMRKKGAPFSAESIKWFSSIDWATTQCAYCDELASEIDHIVPLSWGGTGERENLTPCCRSCNASKGNKMLAEFLGFTDPERNIFYAGSKDHY